MKMGKTLGLFGILITLVSCGKETPPSLIEGNWLLTTIVEINDKGNSAPLTYTDDDGVIYRFAGNRIHMADLEKGTTICKSPTYHLEEKKLVVDASENCNAKEYAVVDLNSSQLILKENEDGINFRQTTFVKIQTEQCDSILKKNGISDLDTQFRP